MKPFQKSCWLLVLIMLMGCAAAQKKVYVSEPQVLKSTNKTFDVEIRPIKLDNPFYVGFQLTVQNKSTDNLSINWDRTRYVHNGRDLGVFVFKGIDPESIPSGIPKDTLAAGATLSKPIYPIKKLGMTGKRDIPKPGRSNFFPGILPSGKNSVHLMIEQGKQRWKELMTFQFDTQNN